MDTDFKLDNLKSNCKRLLEEFDKALQKAQTGRAHPSLLDDVRASVYGEKMALNQLATILTVDASSLKVTPFDAQNLQTIVEAISADERLGLNPTDDGRSIYVPIPALTTERRQQLVKSLQAQKEEFLIQLRHCRRQCIKSMEEAISSKDQTKLLSKQIEQVVSDSKQRLEDLARDKTEEILNISGNS